MPDFPSLVQVRLTDYKSIRSCDVRVPNPAFLVGRNGAGKSNFLDGLRFVHDAVNTNLESAVVLHNGPGNFRRVGSPQVGFDLTFEIPHIGSAGYLFKLQTPDPPAAYAVSEEEVWTFANDERVARGLDSIETDGPRRTLGLSVAASQHDDYRHVYDFIRQMRFYDFSIPAIRALQAPEQGELLRPDGSNLAAVLYRLQTEEPTRFDRLNEYMRIILPGIKYIYREAIGPSEGIRFVADTGMFWAQNMSAGTLMALAVLTALFQPSDSSGRRASVIAIEEPERALHPAAVGALFDAIMEASLSRQVLITTQSPELLDRKDVPVESIVAVVSTEGDTSLGRVAPEMLEILSRHLFTPGELIKLDQLSPE